MKPNKYRTILLFGAPGVGKGTQGAILGCVPGFFHLAMGDVFRAIDKSSDVYREIQSYSSKGNLVPDDLTIRIWQNGVDQRVAAGSFRPNSDVLVLDGLPRNVNQAKLVSDKVDILKIIHIVCTDIDAMVQRMRNRSAQEGRADDKDDVIRHRFAVYDKETAPVLEYYYQDLIANVDAMGTPIEVLGRVVSAVVAALDQSQNRTRPASPAIM
jgi:adenylate kinase